MPPMLTDLIAYILIAAAAFVTLRYLWRQLRPGADPTCGCGDCGGCAQKGECPSSMEELPTKKP